MKPSAADSLARNLAARQHAATVAPAGSFPLEHDPPHARPRPKRKPRPADPDKPRG